MTTELLTKKAIKSACRYKVIACGFSKKGELLGTAINRPRFSKYHDGLHAEMALLRKVGSSLHSILLVRVSRDGKLLPIEPCATCAAVLKKLKIKVRTIK